MDYFSQETLDTPLANLLTEEPTSPFPSAPDASPLLPTRTAPAPDAPPAISIEPATPVLAQTTPGPPVSTRTSFLPPSRMTRIDSCLLISRLPARWTPSLDPRSALDRCTSTRILDGRQRSQWDRYGLESVHGRGGGPTAIRLGVPLPPSHFSHSNRTSNYHPHHRPVWVGRPLLRLPPRSYPPTRLLGRHPRPSPPIDLVLRPSLLLVHLEIDSRVPSHQGFPRRSDLGEGAREGVGGRETVG